MVDEDDDDYMSDLSRFLPIESPAPGAHGQNGRPVRDGKGSFRGKDKRKGQQGEQQKEAEEVQRKDGLGCAIPSTNIGFKMLQQMGYTPGGALGKHGQGLLEPVNIDLKRSRTGLGRDSAAKEEEFAKDKRAEVDRMRNMQKETALKADFQERRRDSWHSRKIISDYKKASATYLQLEEISVTVKDLAVPLESSSVKTESEGAAHEGKEEEEEEEEEITLEILHEMLQRLRSQYNYCLYCGCKYDSFEALLANCPGLEDEDH